jgi:serine/threonine protein kinase
MAKTQLCMGCMQSKDEAVVCPKCGYRTNKDRNPLVLPYQAILNNKFLIGRILGKPGGFGVTYLAWDRILQTTVAVKEYLPRELASRSPDHTTVMLHTPKDKERFVYGLNQFLQEARTLAQFSHPNVVRVREFFQQNNTAYLVMDYYEGVTLEEFVQRKGGKVSEQLAYNILLPVLEGLREVHQKGFLHRDIKPANIYLTKNETPILLDFGAARCAINQKNDTLSVILTSGFAPFEQYLVDADDLLGPWTDIYAYGATLYAITTGVIPQNAVNRYQKDELLSPIRINPALTPQLSRAVMAAMTLDHEQRPQTVHALQALLLSQEPQVTTSPFQLTPKAASPLSTRFVRCPHCKTRNVLLPGQVFSQLHCRHCGKKVKKHVLPKEPSLLSWKAIILLMAAIGIGLVIKKYYATGAFLPAASLPVSALPLSPAAETVDKTLPSVPAQLVEPAPPPARPEPRAMEFKSRRESSSSGSSVMAECEGKSQGASCKANRGACFKIRDQLMCIVTRHKLHKQAVASTTEASGLNKPSGARESAARSVAIPPEFAIAACAEKQDGAACTANDNTLHGICHQLLGELVCIPEEHLSLHQRINRLIHESNNF